jgi:hypothetical protein
MIYILLYLASSGMQTVHSYYLYFGYANILLRKMEKVPRNSGRNPAIPSSSILSIIAGSLIIIRGFLIPLTMMLGMSGRGPKSPRVCWISSGSGACRPASRTPMKASRPFQSALVLSHGDFLCYVRLNQTRVLLLFYNFIRIFLLLPHDIN